MKIKKRFTMWYIKRGYIFGYDFTDVDAPKAVWNCPWWVKPFLFLFSPSVYTVRTVGKQFADGFMAGFINSMEDK